MPVKDVAEGLVAKCRKGDFLDAIDQYYDENIVSVEPVGSADMPAELRGKKAVRRKNERWEDRFEVHGVDVRGPFIGDQEFAVQYTMDVTHKPSGARSRMTEMALYRVANDRIVREEFFYNAGDGGGE